MDKPWSTWRRTCPNATLSITNRTWTGLGLNLGLSIKRLESIQMSDGMDIHLPGRGVMDLNINLISQYWIELPVKILRSLIWKNVDVENAESNISHPYCSDDFRVLDILLWSIVLTIKRGKCCVCVMLWTGMERRPWITGFINKYLQKFKACIS